MPNEFLDENATPTLMAQEQPPEDITSVTGEGVAAVQSNPLTDPDEPASPEEQAQYQDAFKRVMAMIHDTREPGKNGKSIADTVIKSLSNQGMPAYLTIGKTAGNMMRLFHEQSKRAGKEWNGDVLREVGMDLVTELMDIAKVTGAIKNIPEEDSVEEREFAKLAILEGSKAFGEYLLKTKQADVPGTQKGYMEQMQREASSGALDDWDMNVDQMDPEALKAGLAQTQGIVPAEPVQPAPMPAGPPEGEM